MHEKGTLFEVYFVLRRAFGFRDWWPAETPFEVIVGAVLTQNTNWKNVEKAIRNLKQAGVLDPLTLSQADLDELRELIRPAGYYRQKAPRLRTIAAWVAQNCIPEDTLLGQLKWRTQDELREELLALKGIGPETADSIMLYALEKPVFVVDAYTVRALGRHGFIEPGAGYYDVQELFHHRLPPDVKLFQDFHAQFVELGKRCCKKRAPKCGECPLRPLLGDPTELDED